MMKYFITNKSLLLIKNVFFLGLLFFTLGAQAKSSGSDTVVLLTPTGQEIQTLIVKSEKSKSQGLSGLTKKAFKKDQGMLFFYIKDGVRKFWMPDTYFDLDIFFLDKNLKILYVERDATHHPGYKEPPTIYRTKVYYSRHVFEMRSDSSLAKKLRPGQKLSLKKGFSL